MKQFCGILILFLIAWILLFPMVESFYGHGGGGGGGGEHGGGGYGGGGYGGHGGGGGHGGRGWYGGYGGRGGYGIWPWFFCTEEGCPEWWGLF